MLETVELCFSYGRRSRPVITDRSISLEPGAVVGLAGPSGSGKSTLLFLLALMLRPSSGVLRVFGQDVGHWSDRQRSLMRLNEFGFMFQDAVLDPTRTVLDNVIEVAAYGAGTRRQLRKRATGLLEQFDVDVPGNRRPGQISGGQAQRIALCRALIAEPTIVFADEPTASLDTMNADKVTNAFRQHALQGGLVVIASHDPRTLAACDRVIRL